MWQISLQTHTRQEVNRMISDLLKHKQPDYKFAHSMFAHFKKLKARESLTTSGKKIKVKRKTSKSWWSVLA